MTIWTLNYYTILIHARRHKLMNSIYYDPHKPPQTGLPSYPTILLTILQYHFHPPTVLNKSKCSYNGDNSHSSLYSCVINSRLYISLYFCDSNNSSSSSINEYQYSSPVSYSSINEWSDLGFSSINANSGKITPINAYSVKIMSINKYSCLFSIFVCSYFCSSFLNLSISIISDFGHIFSFYLHIWHLIQLFLLL